MVIGLGHLGSAMTNTLTSLGHEILGIDSDEDLVQEFWQELPTAHLVAADATDESTLRNLNVAHFDAAAVVIGGNMEASILATANVKELGVPFAVSLSPYDPQKVALFKNLQLLEGACSENSEAKGPEAVSLWSVGVGTLRSALLGHCRKQRIYPFRSQMAKVENVEFSEVGCRRKEES